MLLAEGTGLLAKIRHFVPKDTLKSLYFSFVNPYIDYNLLNWGMASATELEAISLKMKKSVRILSFKDKYSHSTPLFKELKILPLTQFIEFILICTVSFPGCVIDALTTQNIRPYAFLLLLSSAT